MRKILLCFFFIFCLHISSSFQMETTAAHQLGDVETYPEEMLELVPSDLPFLSVQQYGAVGDGIHNDSQAIQMALDTAKELDGAIVYLPEGVYALEDTLTIFEKTTLLLDPDAVLLRNASMGRMLVNGNQNVYGYQGQSNIQVIGGTFDGNAQHFSSRHNAISFGHAQNITLSHITIKNIYAYHHVEFNAIQNGTIQYCTFKDFVLGSRVSEAVQLDLMKSKKQFGAFGFYDQTACQNIVIKNSHFENLSRGIGSHSSTKGIYHRSISIVDNYFKNVQREAIHLLNYDGVVISGNTFIDCKKKVIAHHSKNVMMQEK